MILHAKILGEGTPLVILHGLFGSLDNWAGIGKILSTHFNVILVDQRNHGKSFHNSEWNYTVMADDLFQFLRDQHIDKAHILGHSMGGKTAMTFAHLHPAFIDKLIIVDIAPKAYPPFHQDIIQALASIQLERIDSRSAVDKQLASQIPELAVRQFLLKSLIKRNNHFEWKFNLQTISKHYKDIIEEITIPSVITQPTLFIRGAYSDYITDKDWENIQSIFSQVSLETIPDSGHWIHAESPKPFLEAVNSFLLK